MLTFIISKEDFRRMIHGSREVETGHTVDKDNQKVCVLDKSNYSFIMVCLQDESEPARCRIVKVVEWILRDKKVSINFKMLYE